MYISLYKSSSQIIIWDNWGGVPHTGNHFHNNAMLTFFIFLQYPLQMYSGIFTRAVCMCYENRLNADTNTKFPESSIKPDIEEISKNINQC